MNGRNDAGICFGYCCCRHLLPGLDCRGAAVTISTLEIEALQRFIGIQTAWSWFLGLLVAIFFDFGKWLFRRVHTHFRPMQERKLEQEMRQKKVNSVTPGFVFWIAALVILFPLWITGRLS